MMVDTLANVTPRSIEKAINRYIWGVTAAWMIQFHHQWLMIQIINHIVKQIRIIPSTFMKMDDR